MPTPAYVPLNPNTPSGATQAPDAYATSDLANVRALRDAIVSGFAPGWAFAYDGTNLAAIRYTWSSGALRLRMTLTYTNPGGVNYVTKLKWEWSNDSAATYAPMGSGGLDSNITIDANGTPQSIDRDAGFLAFIVQALNAFQYSKGLINPHIAGVGAAVHGLGTMSTQNANAVAITGGSALNLGTDSMYLHAVLRIYPKAPAYLVNGAVWNWAAYTGNHDNIVAGNSVANIAGIAAGEVKRLFVSGAGAVTIGSGAVSFNWAAGHPVWSAGVGTLINCVAINSAYVMATTIPLP